VRGMGAPDNVNLSSNAPAIGGVVNYSRGQRAGIYTFTAGRRRRSNAERSRWRSRRLRTQGEEEAGGT